MIVLQAMLIDCILNSKKYPIRYHGVHIKMIVLFLVSYRVIETYHSGHHRGEFVGHIPTLQCFFDLRTSLRLATHVRCRIVKAVKESSDYLLDHYEQQPCARRILQRCRKLHLMCLSLPLLCPLCLYAGFHFSQLIVPYRVRIAQNGENERREQEDEVEVENSKENEIEDDAFDNGSAQYSSRDAKVSSQNPDKRDE